jgi:hypothetical protein
MQQARVLISGLALCSALGLLLRAPDASAEKPKGGTAAANAGAAAKRANRVLTVSEVTIVGRVQKPIAAVDVSRIPARLTMNRHDQKLLPKIEQALYRAPF